MIKQYQIPSSIILLIFAIFVLITQNPLLLGRPDDILMPVKAKRHGETLIVALSRPVDSSQIQVFFIGDDDHEQKSVEPSIGTRHALKRYDQFALLILYKLLLGKYWTKYYCSCHSLIRGVLMQSCSTGAKNFTKCVFYHV